MMCLVNFVSKSLKMIKAFETILQNKKHCNLESPQERAADAHYKPENTRVETLMCIAASVACRGCHIWVSPLSWRRECVVQKADSVWNLMNVKVFAVIPQFCIYPGTLTHCCWWYEVEVNGQITSLTSPKHFEGRGHVGRHWLAAGSETYSLSLQCLCVDWHQTCVYVCCRKPAGILKGRRRTRVEAA